MGGRDIKGKGDEKRGESLVLVLVLEDLVFGGMWRKRRESVGLTWTHYSWLELGSEG